MSVPVALIDFPRYLIFCDGAVWSLTSQRTMSPYVSNKAGHLKLRMVNANGKLESVWVHRVVCTAWYGAPPHTTSIVRHLDGDPTNNVAANLIWGTNIENAADRLTHNSKRNKLRLSDVLEIRYMLAHGTPQKEIARLKNVSAGTISQINCGHTWYVPQDEPVLFFG